MSITCWLACSFFSLVFALAESGPRVEGARSLDVARLLQPEEFSSSRLLVSKPSVHLGSAKGKVNPSFVRSFVPSFLFVRPSTARSMYNITHTNLGFFLWSLGRRHAALPTIIGS